MKTPEEFAWALYNEVDFHDHSWSDEGRVADLIRARDAEVAERAWDEGFTRGFYAGASGLYGPASDASEPEVLNPYEREAGESAK